jgi:acetylornithine deacetylase/succinyl-diaminopimelate desuccinylase-like protein
MPGSDPHERVLKAVDDVRDEMVDFLRQLVRIDTVVPPGNN